MRIIQLTAENFARLRAVEIRPDGVIVPIVGKNGQGKTSILRAIWTVLKGKAAAPGKPINDSADAAMLQVQLGNGKVDLIIERMIHRVRDGEDRWELRITDADGKRVMRKPQELIDATLDALSFDPLAFARSSPKEQLAQLRRCVSDIDFDAIERERQSLYAERTAINRISQTARAAAQSVVLPKGKEPEPVDTAELVRQLDAANANNTRRSFALTKCSEWELAAERMLDEAEQLRARAATLEKEAENTRAKVAPMREQIPAQIDISEITSKIADAQRVAITRTAFAERAAHQQRAEEHEQRSGELTQAIVELDARVAAAVREANLPAGLSFGESGVLLNDKPLEQAGTAERIIASAQIAMSLARDLHVMLIDEGSELDRESWAALEKIARERDFQIWVARVDDSGGAGFRIEDGYVSNTNSEAAE